MSISRPVGSFPCMFPTNLTNGLSWLASSGIDLFLSLIPLRSRFPRDLAHWARKRSCFLTNKHYILKFLKTSLKSHSKLYLVDMVRWYKYLRKSSIKWYLSLRILDSPNPRGMKIDSTDPNAWSLSSLEGSDFFLWNNL